MEPRGDSGDRERGCEDAGRCPARGARHALPTDPSGPRSQPAPEQLPHGRDVPLSLPTDPGCEPGAGGRPLLPEEVALG